MVTDALSSAPTSPGKFKDAIGSGLLANPNQRLSHFLVMFGAQMRLFVNKEISKKGIGSGGILFANALIDGVILYVN